MRAAASASALRVTACLALAVAAGTPGPGDARAAGTILVVRTTADDVAAPPAGSLREAVEKLAGPGDVIRFDGPIQVELRANLVIPPELVGLRIEGPAGIRAVPAKGRPRKGVADPIGRLVVLADDVTIEGVNFLHHFVDAAAEFMGVEQVPVDRVTVTKCAFSGNGGVHLGGVSRGEVSDCTFDVTNFRGFAAVIDLSLTSECRILRNTVTARLPLTDFAIADTEGTDDVFDGNTVHSNVFLEMRSGRFIDNNAADAHLFVMTPPSGLAGRVDVADCEAAKVTLGRVDVDFVNNVVSEFPSEATNGEPPRLHASERPGTLLLVAPSGAGQVRAPVAISYCRIEGGEVGLLFQDPGGLADGSTVVDSQVLTANRTAVQVTAGGDLDLISTTIDNVGSSKRSVGIDVRKGDGVVRVLAGTVGAVSGIGLQIDGKGPPVTVTRTRLSRCGREGVRVGRREAVLDSVEVEECTRDGVWCDAGSLVRITGGSVRRNRLSGLFVDSGALVEVRKLACEGNLGIGIDVSPRAVTPNAKKLRANADVSWPELLEFDAATRRVSGRAAPGATVDVYAVEPGARQGNAKNGEGSKWLGEATADASGVFGWTAGECPASRRYTFTATIPHAGRSVTSEFSEDLRCEEGPPLVLASRSDSGAPADADCTTVPFLGSAAPAGHASLGGGRYVAFTSTASNLTADPHVPGSHHVYLHDALLGTTRRLSKTHDAGPFEAGFDLPGSRVADSASVSEDGRFVAFVARSSRIVEDDFDARPTVILHDAQTGQNSPVTDPTLHTQPRLPSGAAAKGGGDYCSISGDGSAVAFLSIGQDWDSIVENQADEDVFVWDRATGAVDRVTTPDGVAEVANPYSLLPTAPRLSFDGRYCVFATRQSLTPGAAAGGTMVYRRDRASAKTELVSVDATGAARTGTSAVVSDDGRSVVFVSKDALVPEDANGIEDVYLCEFGTGSPPSKTVTRLSFAPDGSEIPASSVHARAPTTSGDARLVAFVVQGVHTTPGGTITRASDTFLLDRSTGAITELTGPGGLLQGAAFAPALSRDGSAIAFVSDAPNLVAEVATADLDEVYLLRLPTTE